MAKDSFLLSKIREVHIHKARIFSYEDRLEYERSPEIIHWLVAILSSFQETKSPLQVQVWAGFEAFMTAVRAVDYNPTLVTIVASLDLTNVT